jgi:hypothetical protein
MSWRSLGRNLRTAWLINNWTDNMGLGEQRHFTDLHPSQCVAAVGGGVKAIFSRRRSASNPPNCSAMRA